MSHGPIDTYLLIGGDDLTSETLVLEDEVANMSEESNPFGVTMKEHKLIGLGEALLEASGGLYDTKQAGLLRRLQENIAFNRVAYGMSGDDTGADATLLSGALSTIWRRIAQKDQLTKANAFFKVSGGQRRARVLHGLTARTADGNSQATSVDNHTDVHLGSVAVTSSSLANPSVITTAVPHGLVTGDVVVFTGHTSVTPDINGGVGYAVTVTGASTFTIPVNVTDGGVDGVIKKVNSVGAVADLHVPELTLGGHTNVTIRVLHSADNITFVSLGSFTGVTTVAETKVQRLTIAGAIYRYTAIDWDFTGAGAAPSIVPYVALSRD